MHSSEREIEEINLGSGFAHDEFEEEDSDGFSIDDLIEPSQEENTEVDKDEEEDLKDPLEGEGEDGEANY